MEQVSEWTFPTETVLRQKNFLTQPIPLLQAWDPHNEYVWGNGGGSFKR